MSKWVGKICQTENKSSLFNHHRPSKIRITEVCERNRNAWFQFKLLDRVYQPIEIRRTHLNGNIKGEGHALHTMQNAGHSTANHKLDAAISQRYEYFLEVIFHFRNYVLFSSLTPDR